MNSSSFCQKGDGRMKTGTSSIGILQQETKKERQFPIFRFQGSATKTVCFYWYHLLILVESAITLRPRAFG